jgi:uncharacterized protein involved in response to NO
MTTTLAILFLVSLAGMGGLGIYGAVVVVREMVQEKAWGILAFLFCLLVFIVSNIALHALGFFPEAA